MQLLNSKMDRGSQLFDEPIWVPPTVRKYVEDHVVLPLRDRDMFHPELNPVLRTHAIFGREGVGKAHAMKHLLGDEAILLTVTFGNTSQATQLLVQCAREAPIIIVQNAHLLCFEPDNNDTMRFCLDLKTFAEDNDCIIVGLFDRIPSNGNPGDTSLLAVYQRNFWNQWDSQCYFACPDVPFREQYWRYTFELAEKQFLPINQEKTKVSFSLRSEDHVELVEASSASSILDMDVWRRSVFKDVFVPRTEPLVVDILFLSKYFHNLHGYSHMTQKKCDEIEKSFRSFAGIYKKPEERKKAEAPKVGTEKRQFPTFSEEGATLEGAKEELKKAKMSSLELA